MTLRSSRGMLLRCIAIRRYGRRCETMRWLGWQWRMAVVLPQILRKDPVCEFVAA